MDGRFLSYLLIWPSCRHFNESHIFKNLKVPIFCLFFDENLRIVFVWLNFFKFRCVANNLNECYLGQKKALFKIKERDLRFHLIWAIKNLNSGKNTVVIDTLELCQSLIFILLGVKLIWNCWNQPNMNSSFLKVSVSIYFDWL